MRQPVPFGKYLLLDRISVGGMAEVFKAKSYGVEGFEKIIAIKRILPTMGEDRDFIKMFIDEAKIAGQLAHANICQIFELGRIDGSHFIAMEYIWGKDLLQIQNRLRKIKQPMPVAMACFIIAKVLEGLDYAHRKRDPLGRPLEIVHRDCSPQNVLVSYEGEVKVIDFGIAKATSRNSRTMAGVLKGKFGYMSPEQVRGLPLDRRSDIFALGTMIYECLTSERLFQGETDFSTLEKVRNVDIRPPREINPNIPEAVERVILKALAKDVDDRYQWCSEMLADLQQYLMSQEVVFTAKSLSSWLKEVFLAEIDKERQLLEQYKRVGRDGLINNVPAAEAKIDVNEGLGEAGAPEGDATQLGGPSFEELEAAVAAAAGPAMGSPAARGSQRPASEAEDGDFGEEAPTEIFGEIDNNNAAAAAPPAAGRTPTPAQQPARPSAKPPAAPPPLGRAPSQMNRPQSQSVPPPLAAHGHNGGAQPQHMEQPQNGYPNIPNFARPSGQQPAPPYPQAQGSARQLNPSHTPPPQTAQGFPSQPNLPPPQVDNAIAHPGSTQGRTLMGAVAPPELQQYQAAYRASQNGMSPAGGYPMQASQPQMPQNPNHNPMMNPSGQLPSHGLHNGGMNPSQPQMLAHPSSGSLAPGQMQGYPQAQNYEGYDQYGQPLQHQQSGPMPGYGQYTQQNNQTPVPAVDAPPVSEGKKKSSIGRDVAIGVAIAAVVLGGFLAVKFFVLDADDSSGSDTTTTSTIATLKVELKPPVEAELFLDGSKTREHVVKNNDELPINAGKRKIRIVAKDGQVCEQELDLKAGEKTTVSCELDVKTVAVGSGEKPPEPGKGSDVKVGSGSDVGKGSDAKVEPGKGSDAKVEPGKGSDAKVEPGKGSAMVAVKPPDPKPPEKKPDVIAAKPPEKKPDVIVPKPPDKKPDVVVVKKPPDKKPPDKMPPEDNPADRAGSVQDGYVVVSSTPKAKVSVDGAETGLTTPTKLKLSPGKHKIGFAYGTTKTVFTVTVKAGETVTFNKDLE